MWMLSRKDKTTAIQNLPRVYTGPTMHINISFQNLNGTLLTSFSKFAQSLAAD